ncbi:ABC transporter permease [Microbulbifer thermotolerans]|uniref:ABC transporter permease n=1 Tax=Microbulbifer thermotolerans TaxID=252514 RepID=UPI0022499E4C|nr:ABC transporter permease [Microbulbifer thermotolerans]MCX2784261.1 ABC transporter permease [Microbulbifer thermotolerans]MCX2794338.1 ABC transporter permease [Microbulbifer thermotolerans]MCX2831545.1 ABC transporter permease [Microbulbifer thermotolerans]MCX2841710.1 ABC transporter permease [Microbulbifer thermotolerans]
MFGYYVSLALRSLRGTPVLSALMVAAIAVGVGASMTTLTLNYMMSQNALQHKDDRLYAVQLDSWAPEKAYQNDTQMPWELTYRDAQALLRSDIPSRQVAMHRWGATVSQENSELRPFTAQIRVTTRDFFALFDIPFIYGNTWHKSSDQNPTREVVLSKKTNEKLFNGENSVGRSINLNGEPFTVVGVIEHWNPTPKVYDLNNGAFKNSEEIYMPFGLHRQLQIYSWGNLNGWKSEDISNYEDLLNSNYVWVQYWVELDNEKKKHDYENFLAAYIETQKTKGYFPRPLKFGLTRPSEWLVVNEVLSDDNRILGWLSLAFLLVCVVNAVALLLAKFLRKAPEAGVRRALGASRKAIFSQHLIESGCIGLIGGVMGILLTLLGLSLIRTLQMGRLDQIASMDWLMMLAAIGLAVLASLLAGIYPAWRISNTNPSVYLKTQ